MCLLAYALLYVVSIRARSTYSEYNVYVMHLSPRPFVIYILHLCGRIQMRNRAKSHSQLSGRGPWAQTPPWKNVTRRRRRRPNTTRGVSPLNNNAAWTLPFITIIIYTVYAVPDLKTWRPLAHIWAVSPFFNYIHLIFEHYLLYCNLLQNNILFKSKVVKI